MYKFYESMEEHNVMLSFKGEISADLLDSILNIVESKLESTNEPKKVKKKMFNVLVECLQNLYHHIDENDGIELDGSTGIFMITDSGLDFEVYTGNYILTENVKFLKARIDKVNALSKEELRNYYKEILDNGKLSSKGGGGLGMIDIARKSGQNLGYSFMKVKEDISFFTLKVSVKKEN